MKQLFILLILIAILSAYISYAGKSFPLEFKKNEEMIILYKGDRVYFEFDGENHTVILDDIKSNRVEFDIFLYQEIKFNKKQPQYVSTDKEHDIKLDINRDDFYDYKIKVLDFDKEKAMVQFSKINDPKYKTSETIENNETIEQSKENLFNKYKLLSIPIVIIIIIILISLIDNYVKKRRNIYY